MDQLQVLALMELLNPRRARVRETSPEWRGERANPRRRVAAMLRSAADRLEPNRLATES